MLPADKQTAIIAALCEGSSIRSIERMSGCHRDTIMRLGLRVGQACATLMDQKMRQLPCREIQIDEMWGYIGKKQVNATPEENANGMGDVWTYVAIDPETKLVPSYICGKRDYSNTYRFLDDLYGRMTNRIQLSSDGANAYLASVREVFGSDVDYGQIIKELTVPNESVETERKYSLPKLTGVRYETIIGDPEKARMSTCHVERQNLTMRMHIRRLTRLTNAFSKKFENFCAAVSMHFAYYNFVKSHSSVRMTPAMAADIESDYWTVEDLLELTR